MTLRATISGLAKLSMTGSHDWQPDEDKIKNYADMDVSVFLYLYKSTTSRGKYSSVAGLEIFLKEWFKIYVD